MITRLRRARRDLATMNHLLPTAEQLARAEGIERPGGEHLVLAALGLDDRIAVDVFAGVDLDPAALQAAFVDQHDAALRRAGIAADDDAIDASLPEPSPPTGTFRSQDSLQQLFQRAVTLAKQDQTSLDSGHVLLAALESDHGVIARTLEQCGIDRDDLRAATRTRRAANR